MDRSDHTIQLDDATIAVPRHDLEPGNRPCSKEFQQRLPIVRRPVRQQDRDLRRRSAARRPPSELTRRPVIHFLKSLVEASHAPKAAGQRHLDHRQPRLMNQLLRQQHATRLRDRDRRSADMATKQPPQLTLADAQPIGERRNIRRVERSRLDQLQRPRNGRLGAAPGVQLRRALGTATQAGPKAGRLRRSRSRHKRAILQLRRARDKSAGNKCRSISRT